MSHGNLASKVVAFDFWPACENCRFFASCKVRPCHPAYPHTWHWGREFAEFADGYLIVRSWVGSSAIGQPHTGCKSYAVDPHHVSTPQLQHRRYLDLEHEQGELESAMEALERRQVCSRTDADCHARLFRRYQQVLKQQPPRRSVANGPRPLAAAING